MKKFLICTLFFCIFLLSGDMLFAQLASKKSDSANAVQRRRIIEGYSAEFYAGNRIENATPANVLKWAKEALSKMEPLVPKLEKIKATNPGKPSTDVLKLLAQVSHLKEINAKGARLKAADAKKYDRLLFDGIAMMLDECLEANPGSECCFSGHNSASGYGGMWSMMNCFVARFPGIN